MLKFTIKEIASYLKQWELTCGGGPLALRDSSILHCKELILKIPKQIFPEKELRGHSPNFHIHVSVSDLYILTINLPITAGNMWTDPWDIWIVHRHINVEIRTEAVQFPEKEYINGIFVAV
jgi:hypothetical protein